MQSALNPMIHVRSPGIFDSGDGKGDYMGELNGCREEAVERWTTIDEALDFAIGEEQAAADFYLRLAQMTKVPGMRAALVDFAREEKSHKDKLEAIKAGAEYSFASQQVADLKIAEYVVDVTPDPEMTYRDALIVAMKKEKAAFKFYLNLAMSMTDDTLKTVFLALAQEEAKHKLRFEVEYDDTLAEN
jgi:rubrerythrin